MINEIHTVLIINAISKKLGFVVKLTDSQFNHKPQTMKPQSVYRLPFFNSCTAKLAARAVSAI